MCEPLKLYMIVIGRYAGWFLTILILTQCSCTFSLPESRDGGLSSWLQEKCFASCEWNVGNKWWNNGLITNGLLVDRNLMLSSLIVLLAGYHNRQKNFITHNRHVFCHNYYLITWVLGNIFHYFTLALGPWRRMWLLTYLWDIMPTNNW